MRPILFIVLFLSLTQYSTAQNHDEVVDYIENKKYTNTPRAQVYVDVNNFDIKEGFLEDIQTGLLYGVKNTRITEEPKLVNLDGSDPKNQSGFTSMLAKSGKGPHYLFSCQVADFNLVYNEKNDGSSYDIKLVLKGVDVVMGTVEFYKVVELKGKSREVKRDFFKNRSSDMSKNIAKNVRENMRDLLKRNFPIANWIDTVEEIKKDKTKVVSADELRYMKQAKPKWMYAYVVDQEIEVNGTKHFTFLKIGELKKPYKDKSKRDHIFYKVGKGDKQILASINQGKTVYLTTMDLGTK